MSRALQAVLGVVDGAVDRVLCLVGAILFSQLPEFMQQYLQRLGGHLDEARRVLAQFQDVAMKSGITLDQLIAKTQASIEPGVTRLGGLMQDAVTRVAYLAGGEAAIRDASILTRPFVFVRHIDFPIARATWKAFKFAVPTTVEGLFHAGLGMLVALLLYHGLVKYPLRRMSRPAHERLATG